MAQDSSDRFIDETRAAAKKHVMDARDKFSFLRGVKDEKVAEEAARYEASLDALLRGGQIPAIKNVPSAEDVPNIVSIKSELDFSNIAGMDNVKEELKMHVIIPAKNPGLCKYYGKNTGAGILLYGPGGSGKTYFAKAIAGELKKRMMLFEPADLSKFVGDSEKYVRAIFKKATDEDCVLFVDEIDALGQARDDSMQGYERKLAAQLLIELEKFIRHGGTALAATNFPSNVDLALRRPGRFGREIYVGLPDSESIKQLIAIKSKDMPALQCSNLSYEKICPYVENRTIAEICQVIDYATDRGFSLAKEEPITLEDIARGDMLTPRKAPIWAKLERMRLEQNGQISLYPKIVEMDLKYNAVKKETSNSNGLYR